MDSDEESDVYSVKGVAGSIILINVLDTKSAEQAQVATCQLIRHYLRTQTSQYIGVSLYGTDVDDTSIFAQKYVKDIFPLTSPTLDDYKKLETTNISEFKQSKDLVLTEVLGHCSKMFSACKKSLSSRTIIMLTTLAQPPIIEDQDPTLEFVADLVKSGIELKIMNIAERDYKIHEFYNDFLFEAYKLDDEQDLTMPSRIWDVEEIKNNLITQCDRHLAIAEICLDLGADVSIGVKIYKLLKSNTSPKSSYTHSETNEAVVSATKTVKYTKEENVMNEDQADEEKKQMPISREEILKCQEFGGEKIEFKQKEYESLKNPFGPNILRLLGFKPADTLCKEKWFIEKCYFIFPSEAKIEGSTIAFKALYYACVEMKAVAICMLCLRVNSKPRMVALSPSTKPFGINVDLGFDVIILPFAENVRDPPEIEEDDDIETSSHQKEEMVSMMNDIINQVKFNYHPEMFEDPVLQSKYRAMEAQALHDTEIAEIQDTTQPNEKIFEEIDEEKFYKLFGPFGASTMKRAREPKPTSTGTKKIKTEDIDVNLLKEDIKNKNLNKYTMDQLKQILKKLDIAGLSKKKKGELIELVYEHYA